MYQQAIDEEACSLVHSLVIASNALGGSDTMTPTVYDTA
jgi:hypothetical protein